MTDIEHEDDFIAGLTAGLVPVRPQRLWILTAILAAIGAAQLAGFAVFTRHVPFADAFAVAAWPAVAKTAALGLGALAMTGLALRSFSPAAKDAKLAALVVAAGIAMLAGLGLDWSAAQPAMPGKEGTLLAPRDGLRCLVSALTLGLPLAIALFAMAKNAAPARPTLTGTLIGAAAGFWGGFVYAVQCPYVSAVYVVLWYGLAAAIGCLAGRLIIGRHIRW